MTNKQLLSLLNSKSACIEAIEWVNGQSAKEAWEACNRPDWLFWISGQIGVDRKQITRAACKCARLAFRFVKNGENRPRICIETTEAWCDGKATLQQVREARYAASAYAAAAASADAAAAASAYAAAAAAAAYAAAAADADADADARSEARSKMRKNCCDEIRKVISFEELLKLAKKNDL